MFDIDYPRANAVLGELDSISKKITSMLHTLEQNTQRNMVDWKSENARTAYDQTKRSWDISAERMPQLVIEARMALADIIKNYDTADRSNGHTFASARRGRP